MVARAAGGGLRDRRHRPLVRAHAGLQPDHDVFAVLGTTFGLLITGALAAVVTEVARFTPAQGSDEVVYLQQATNGTIDLSGLLLAAVIFGGLGLLNDVAISQVATVEELQAVDGHMAPFELFRRTMNIGTAHLLAAMINTSPSPVPAGAAQRAGAGVPRRSNAARRRRCTPRARRHYLDHCRQISRRRWPTPATCGRPAQVDVVTVFSLFFVRRNLLAQRLIATPAGDMTRSAGHPPRSQRRGRCDPLLWPLDHGATREAIVGACRTAGWIGW
ncbi:MAG: YibE/F family protein [Chloroflexota bacterium]